MNTAQEHPFLDELKRFAQSSAKKYRQKVYRLVIIFFIAQVLVMAIAIALSKILLVLAGTAAIGFLVYWVVTRLRKFEFATFFEYIKNLLQRLSDSIRGKEDELRDLNRDPAQFSLLELLREATPEERAGLEKFSEIKFDSPEQFEQVIRKKASNDIFTFIKQQQGGDKDLTLATYSDMLDLAGGKLKIKRDGRNDREYEKDIVRIAFDKMVGAMNDKDRELLEHEIKNYAEQHLRKKNLDIAVGASGLLAVHLGGFGSYLMATSALHAVSSALGATLAFGAYSTLSAALAAALGPIGVGALTIWGLYKIASPNIKVTILIVLAAASIRERLLYERPLQREVVKGELEDLMAQRLEIENLLVDIGKVKAPIEAYKFIEQSDGVKAIEHLPNEH